VHPGTRIGAIYERPILTKADFTIVTPSPSPSRRQRPGRTRSGLAGLRRWWRQAAVLGLAIAVPAWATPAGWNPFDAPAIAEPVDPMGFEVPGESFPGSAFYYLEDAPYAPLSPDSRVYSDAQPDPTLIADARTTDPLAGPSALPLIAHGTGLDQARALECMTMAIYYEGASEPDAGQRAIAQVVLNRVAHPSYPGTVCGVVFQGSSRKTGCQFSFTCDGSLRRTPSRTFWNRARRVAMAALGGAVYRPVGLATHYHTVQIYPYWAPSLDRVGTIGAHHFYKWKGAAGLPSAFRFAHRGGEPAPVPYRPSAEPQPLADPIALARAYEESHPQAAAAAAATSSGAVAPAPDIAPATATRAAPGGRAKAPAPPPQYSSAVKERGGDALFSGERLPEAGSVKPEYAGSGQWIGDAR
jgi:hypothetical protein